MGIVRFGMDLNREGWLQWLVKGLWFSESHIVVWKGVMRGKLLPPKFKD